MIPQGRAIAVTHHEYLVVSGIGHVLAWLFEAAAAAGIVALVAMLIGETRHHHRPPRHA
jgi:hypothetical protein